jgi:phage terminase Nu1 subunit (DNA packaging protein)
VASKAHSIEFEGNTYRIASKTAENRLENLAVSTTLMAKLLQMPPQNLSSAGSKGELPQIGRGLWPFGRVLEEYIGALKVRARYQPQGNLAEKLLDDKMRLDRAKAEKAELEVAQMKGDLVDAVEVRQAWCDMVIDMRSRLEGIPAKASLLIAGEDDPVEIERKLKALMREALIDLAETEIEVLDDDLESV